MAKIAFMFSGQGAQTVGMGKELAEQYPVADQVFEEATASLGLDMKQLVWESDEETLKITENTQPAILTMSIAALRVLEEAGVRPDVVAGLSLGEYSAHVAAGSIPFADAVRLVKKRGKYMQEEVPVGVGAMAAIMGLDEENVLAACNEASSEGIVEPANYNCPGQIVIAGQVKAVEKACELAKDKGARRAQLLPVSAPFHCTMLVGAGEKLAKELEMVTFSDLTVPLIANVNADYVKSKEEIKHLLVEQVSNGVRWEATVRRMLADGVDTFIEVGPGKALSGFVKRITKDAAIYNVEDLTSLKNTLDNLQ